MSEPETESKGATGYVIAGTATAQGGRHTASAGATGYVIAGTATAQGGRHTASAGATGYATAATATAQGGNVRAGWSSRMAQFWYADAVAEVENSKDKDIHSRRREILFAVCCAESYIYEWVMDNAKIFTVQGLRERIDEYFDLEPKGTRFPTLCDQWKDVPKMLLEAGVIRDRPDHSGEDWEDFLKLIDLRNAVVHAHLSRNLMQDSTGYYGPPINTSTLAELPAGWATSTVATRIRKLNEAAGTETPSWVIDP